MEAVAQKETVPHNGGTSSDRLVIHPHLLKPRLKSSTTSADFQSQLRQYANGKQGRNTSQEYAAALGEDAERADSLHFASCTRQTFMIIVRLLQ